MAEIPVEVVLSTLNNFAILQSQHMYMEEADKVFFRQNKMLIECRTNFWATNFKSTAIFRQHSKQYPYEGFESHS